MKRKARPIDDPYEIWISSNGEWEWWILKKYPKEDFYPFSRWFCAVFSPVSRMFTANGYELLMVSSEVVKEAAKPMPKKKIKEHVRKRLANE